VFVEKPQRMAGGLGVIWEIEGDVAFRTAVRFAWLERVERHWVLPMDEREPRAEARSLSRRRPSDRSAMAELISYAHGSREGLGAPIRELSYSKTAMSSADMLAALS
jgi:hypothetical protein